MDLNIRVVAQLERILLVVSLEIQPGGVVAIKGSGWCS